MKFEHKTLGRAETITRSEGLAARERRLKRKAKPTLDFVPDPKKKVMFQGHNSKEVGRNKDEYLKNGSHSHDDHKEREKFSFQNVDKTFFNQITNDDVEAIEALKKLPQRFLINSYSKEDLQEHQSFDPSEVDQGVVRWGTRKKVTSQYRFRGNSLGGINIAGKSDGGVKKMDKDQNLIAVKEITSHCKVGMLKVPKDMQGRWSNERYKAAQLKLLEIMREKGASPGNPILRPALRHEARKHIGDTGLLDHLLKHMTDTVIRNGERFRRRHNCEGAMEYWLEDARLLEIRKEAGVEPYWVPPPGWKIGDAVLDNHAGGMSPSQVLLLEDIREDVKKLKSQMQSWDKFAENLFNIVQDMKLDLICLKDSQEEFSKMAQGTKEQAASISRLNITGHPRFSMMCTTDGEDDAQNSQYHKVDDICYFLKAIGQFPACGSDYNPRAPYSRVDCNASYTNHKCVAASMEADILDKENIVPLIQLNSLGSGFKPCKHPKLSSTCTFEADLPA